MNKKEFRYSEDILQWIWENLFFDSQNLVTERGDSIQILEKGMLNNTDGPDFKNAQLVIGGVRWFGSVEFHLKSTDWKNHGHHLDEKYNQVILHVVAQENPQEVYRQDGSSPPVLNLLPYLEGELLGFIKNYHNSFSLPCASYISEDALLAQIDIAHKQYLEKKGDDFLAFFNPSETPSIAWKKALVLSLFDGYGIVHNRKSMQEMGKWFLSQEEATLSILISKALNYAGFGDSASNLKWNHRGVFPANHPKKRIVEAITLASKVMSTPFEEFLSDDALKLWEKWNEGEKTGVTQKVKLLFGTVYLPALHILGSLFHAQNISSLAYREWDNLRLPIPKSILSSFSSFQNISLSLYSKKLGSVHQIRSYCNDRRCHECLVLKKVITS